MSQSDNIAYSPSPISQPSPDLKSLERLVGSWRQSGGIAGEIRYESVEGGFFLIQHVDLDHNGHKIKGLEIIGHLQAFGEEPTPEIHSRFYSFLDGMTLDYVYETEGDTLTIWGGYKGSPAYYQGKFSEDGDTLTGAWVYPGGGGYTAIARRIKS